MRDLLVMLIILGGSLYSLKHPWVGAVLWTWVSVMNPHSLTWSSGGLPFALIVAASTTLGFVLSRDRWTPFLAPAVWALLAFWLWTCVTLPFSMYFDDSIPLWSRSSKIFFMTFICLALLNTKRKVDWFVGILAFSIGFYGVKGGIFTIVNGGNFMVWGPGGFIEGNNELALALLMTIPLIRYLQTQAPRGWVRHALTVAMGLTAVSAIGSYSRGALVGMTAMAIVLWLKGDRKILWGFGLALMAVAALSVMPQQWWDRMDTIQTYDQDSSATGRINAWYMAWNLAKNNFFGGGFSIYTPEVFARYAPDPNDIHAAHSIYFQVLGEHGFVGLFLFLLIWFLTWISASSIIRQVRHRPADKWAGQLAAMIQVSLVGYGVGGAFLSLAYFDLPYDLMVCAAVTLQIVRRTMVSTELAASPALSASAASAASSDMRPPSGLDSLPPPRSEPRPDAGLGVVTKAH